jgi:hypothetical protein
MLVSPDVEQFGTNIPAVDRQIDENGNVTWFSWSDGNSNFNHWLGILSTEYRLLKNNNNDYQETLSLLLYSMIALERLDLYSEYLLRTYHNIKGSDSDKPGFINYPEDMNGFLLRDDVTLGFWMQYHDHFRSEPGNIQDTKDGTETYVSVFKRGAIPKQGMSQDNIIYLLQSLALVKYLVDDEDVSNIEVNFINNYIPEYLKSKDIWVDNTVYFGKWIDDIVDRLLNHINPKYPSQKIVLKPKNNFRARPSKNHLAGIISSRWYILNPVTNDLVAEGNGEDMGVWLNSYGIAEAANFITGKNIYHNDGSDKGLSKYAFKSILFKDLRFLRFGGIPLPDGLDDYMLRALASVADINWNKKSYDLLYLLGDKRKVWTYEHNPLVLVLLHKDKYKKVYEPGIDSYENDMKYYIELLGTAPLSGPSTDYRRPEYHPYWSSSSRLNWPKNQGRKDISPVWEFAGMDYMFLYNLYRLVFESENYNITFENINKSIKNTYKEYPVPEMDRTDLEYFYLPPKQKEN